LAGLGWAGCEGKYHGMEKTPSKNFPSAGERMDLIVVHLLGGGCAGRVISGKVISGKALLPPQSTQNIKILFPDFHIGKQRGLTIHTVAWKTTTISMHTPHGNRLRGNKH
jgi:hypothetical protein